ncbi:MAG: fumarylacetoacetate hydrolase family protein, partial [Armatimonadota bacterium]|nr:fumarylacetoacetate hydrolase family protein [Armatimonadota bacterium]
MRLATYQAGREARVGFVVGDRIVDLEAVARQRRVRVPREMVDVIAEVPLTVLRTLARDAQAWVAAGRPAPPVHRTRLLAPVPRPRKNIVCMGRNYAEHAREGGVAPPEVPVFFTKPPTAVVGPDAPVVCHPVTQQVDYEVELAVVFGRRG